MGRQTYFEKTGKIWVPKGTMRRGAKVELHQMPIGADMSIERSMAIHKQLQDDSALRERLIIAQKMVGKRIMHLDLLAQDMDDATERKIQKHMEFSNKIMKKREKEGDV